MKNLFEKFIKNITLTSNQSDDAKTKYTGVCKTIHKEFYDSDYDGSTKLLFGSYRKKTAIRPMTSDQDVDVLFKIPESTFEQYKDNENGQSELLQKIRGILIDSKYSLGEKPKAWGKVILITTSDGTHNIEILPAYEKDDKSFIIPNTDKGGSWDEFNPRREIKNFKISNEKTNGLSKDLIKMIKRWNQENTTLNLESYTIDNYIINFLSDYIFVDYPELTLDFFSYLNKKENNTFTRQAKNRAKKAIKRISDNNENEAINEYRKIFGNSFPVVAKQLYEVNYNIAPNEEFIEERFEINIDHNISFNLIGKLEKDANGFRKYLHQMSFLPKNKSIVFEVINLKGVQVHDCVFKWKIRNFGEEAEQENKLRGEIIDDSATHKENSLYKGKHFIECYIIKNNKCVAKRRLDVPIR